MTYQTNKTIMINWYYLLWSDAIQYEKKKFGHVRDWKPNVLAGVCFMQMLNLLTIFFWIGGLIEINFFIPIGFFSSEALNTLLSAIITLMLPVLSLNYFFVFRKNNFKTILVNYPNRNGKIYIYYALFSLVLFIVPIFIGLLLNRMGYIK